mgnify:CR=1 FL=1
MNESMINLLNTIRDNASASYQSRIPEATDNNINEIQNLINHPCIQRREIYR